MDDLKRLLTSVKKLSEIPLTTSVQKMYSKAGRKDAEIERAKVLREIEEQDSDSGDSYHDTFTSEMETDSVGSSAFANSSNNEVSVTKTSTGKKRVRKGDVVDFLEKKHMVRKFCLYSNTLLNFTFFLSYFT